MNYTQARNYIDNCYKKGSVYGLETIRALMNVLSNPQNGQRIIHIAGTNGKGSVGTFISNVLIEAGYKTGRFVSPTVYCYEERFQINGRYISNDSFAQVMTMVAEAAGTIDFEPTGFELETAAALCYFNIEQCDVSIIECGLGGKSDATNVIDNNMLTVLTSISLDHTALLGSTITRIAKEKCGIIKYCTQVVSIEQPREAEEVIRIACDKVGAEYSFVSKADIKNQNFNGLAQSFDYGKYKNIKISMLGDYQFENAALALRCVDVLNGKGFIIPEKAVYKGMEAAHWGGRFEVVNQAPLFILDGAHNPDAAQRLKNSLDLYFKGRRMLFIIGVFADKDYDNILKCTAHLAERIFAITAPSPRGLEAPVLVKAIKKYNENAYESDIGSAVEYCLKCKDYITVAFGSLSFIGNITEYVRKFKEY